MRQFLLVLMIALMLAIILVSSTIAAPNIQLMGITTYTIDWSVIGEVNGATSKSTNYKITATIGQMAANTNSVNECSRLCTGFECLLNMLRTYLPLVMSNNQ